MHAATKTAIAVAAGTLAAVLYVRADTHEQASDGRTYLSPWTIDLAAWGAGATLIWLGYRHRSPLVSFLGAAIAALHVASFVKHKRLVQPTLNELVNGEVPIEDVEFDDIDVEMAA